MTIIYDRSKKVYVSDIIEGAWPTRLDAEAAELPQELFGRALEIAAGSLGVAIGATWLILDRAVQNCGGGEFVIPSKSRPGLRHYVSLSNGGCDCDAFLHGQICRHWTAALLIASNDDDEDEDEKIMNELYQQVLEEQRRALGNKSREELIDELFGPPVQVKDAKGRVVFG